MNEITEQQLRNLIGQTEKSIDIMGEVLDEREFQDYCDHAYSCISYHRQSIEKLKRLEE